MTEWLDEEQQRSWRAWIAATTTLRERLSRELQEAHGISLVEYEILVRLSETPGRRQRMSVLAEHTMASRSRLTHQVDSMTRRGLLAREQCAEDRRGQLAVMTEAGWDLLVAAAPTHVAGVRRYLVDTLSAEDLRHLGRSCQAIIAAVESA